MADQELGRRRSTVEEQDEEELAEFGYKQELRRDWGLMHNFGISFSIIVSYLAFSKFFWHAQLLIFYSLLLLVLQLFFNMG
jgi:hypothetical protein